MIDMYRKNTCLIVLMTLCSLLQTQLTAQTIDKSTTLFTPTSDVKPITINPNRTVGLEIDEEVFENLRKNNPEEITLILPGFDGGEIEISFEQFEAFPATVTVGIHSIDGFKEIDYAPRIKTYKVIGGTGTLVFMVDHVIGTFQWEGMQIEIKPESKNPRHSGSKYILFDVNNTIESRSFECGMEEVGTGDGHEIRKTARSENKSMAGCAEVAIDIDSYTYSTFSNVSNATDWALALMTGVSAIYTQEVGALVFLQTTYVHIWNTPDPMSNYTGQASEMLAAFRSIWLSDPNLNAIQRDETHLLTKRGDTGTGGIAYLDVVCSSYAYGFSGYLSGTTSYNISSYSWNLNVVAHELGHNLGSNHTHWCGWPGGPIDNCGSLEGSCSGYTNNPQGQSGTIMSYCHAIGGGSVNLNFHPTVKAYGLQPAIEGSGSCFTGCDGYEPPECAMLGIQGGNQLACNPLTSTYTQQVVIEYENAPDIGLINVNGTLHTINFSPQTITLVNVPAEGQTVDVNAFFTGEETCAATQVACYTQKDPCCAMIRLNYVNPNSNVIRVKNTSPCEGDISDWGVYSNGVYNSFSEIGSGQNLVIPSGEEAQFAWTAWEADPTYGDLQLYGPTNQLMDYIQWGGSGNIDESSSVQLGFWEAGTFVNALPPFEYIGSGEHGAAFWTGADIPCEISDVNVISSTGCDPTTGNYSVDFSVSYVGAPSSDGGLIVNSEPYPLTPSGCSSI